jgi:hypothetical protein
VSYAWIINICYLYIPDNNITTDFI